MHRLYNVLVSQHFLTKDHYFQLFTAACRELEHPGESCLTGNWFQEGVYIDVLELQIANNLSFKDACLKLNVWNSEIEEKYKAYRLDVISNFEKELSSTTGISQKIISIANRRIENNELIPSPDTGLEDFKAEVLSVLTNIENAFKAIKSGEISFSASFQNIFRMFHILKGSSRIMNINNFNAHISTLEDTLFDFSQADSLASAQLDFFQNGVVVARKILDGQNIPFNFKLEKNLTPEKVIQEKFAEPKFFALDSTMVNDFAETFDDVRYQEIESIILKLEVAKDRVADKAELEEDMRNLYRDLHTIKGSSRFIQANLMEKLIHACEDILGFFQTFLSKIEANDFQQFFSLLLQAMDLAWKLRISITTTHSEENFWQNTEAKNKYIEIFQQLKALKLMLDKRGYEVDLAELESMF